MGVIFLLIWAICKNRLLRGGNYWPTVLDLLSTSLRKNKFGNTFFAQSDLKKNFGPIPWQAAEIIGGLLATE